MSFRSVLIMEYLLTHANNRDHKWLVLGWVLFLSMTHFGITFSFGALFVAMLDKYQEDRSTTAVVLSILVGFALTTGVITGILISRFGVVKVTIAGSILTPLGFIVSFFSNTVIFVDIFIGVLSGIGMSFIYISGTVALGYAFTGAHKMLAMALQNAFTSLATMVLPYLLKWLLDTYGLNGTYLILGGILLHSFPAAITLYYDQSIAFYTSNAKSAMKVLEIKESDVDQKAHHGSRNKRIDVLQFAHRFIKHARELFTIPYTLLLIATAIVVSSINAYNVIVIDVFVWKGYTVQEGLLSFIPYSICGLLTKIIPGVIKFKRGVNSTILPIIFCACGAAGVVVIYVSSDHTTLLVGHGLLGISIGGVVTSSNIIVAKMVAPKRLGIAFGLIFTIIGILSAVCAPLFGAIRDKTGAYAGVLFITAGIQVAGMILFVFTLVSRRRLQSPHKVAGGIEDTGGHNWQ